MIQLPDHYETLQVSPRADRETIERVFRHLAKRYHPDNKDSGNTDTFTRIVEAYHVLTDPEQRARYDLTYEQVKAAQWRIFDQETTRSEIAADARIRDAILALLYVARRNDNANPAIGAVEFERTLGCPESLMAFHLWYLREQGLIKRNESGGFASRRPASIACWNTADRGSLTPISFRRASRRTGERRTLRSRSERKRLPCPA